MDKTRRETKTSLTQDNKKPASQRTFDWIHTSNVYLVPETVINPLVTLRLTSSSPGT